MRVGVCACMLVSLSFLKTDGQIARAPVNNLAGAILSMALERAYVPSGAHVSETGTHANGDFYVDVKISRY